jgi:hypothetical protein
VTDSVILSRFNARLSLFGTFGAIIGCGWRLDLHQLGVDCHDVDLHLSTQSTFQFHVVSISAGVVGHVLGTHSESQVRALFAVFALGFTAIALEMVFLNLHAWQLREPLRLNPRKRAMTFHQVIGFRVGIGILSFLLGLCLPRAQIEWSGWIYFSILVLVPLHQSLL